MTEDETDLQRALRVAHEKFKDQIDALGRANDAQILAGFGLVAVDIEGKYVVNYISVHPATTLNIYQGIGELFGVVRHQLVEDGLLDDHDEEEEENNDYEDDHFDDPDTHYGEDADDDDEPPATGPANTLQ